MTSLSTSPKKKADVYAEILFEFASKNDDANYVVCVRNNLKSVIELVNQNVEVRSSLESNDVDVSSKESLVCALCIDSDDVLKQVLKNMAKEGDFAILRHVLRRFEERIALELKLCIVDVVTAVELDDNLRNLIKNKTKSELGIDAILNETIDKSIIGGIIMSVNGKCIDASMITQLNHARSVLKAS